MKKYNWFVLHGINNKTFDAMSTLNFKDSILKRYYIFDWNGKDCFVEVFRKSQRQSFADVPQNGCS